MRKEWQVRHATIGPLMIAGMLALGATCVRAQAPESGSCVTMPLPAGLDDADQLVDTAATMSVLRTMKAGETVLSLVGTKSYGAPQLSIHAKHGDVDADSVQKLVASHLRSTDGTPAPWAVRLRATTGASGSIALAAPELCGAHPVATQGPVVGRIRVYDTDEVDELQRAGPSLVRVWISPTGSVERTELVMSSGNPLLDDSQLKIARDLHYQPARFEGIPIAGTYDFRVK